MKQRHLNTQHHKATKLYMNNTGFRVLYLKNGESHTWDYKDMYEATGAYDRLEGDRVMLMSVSPINVKLVKEKGPLCPKAKPLPRSRKIAK